MERIILIVLAVEYSTLLVWYAGNGLWNKALYWLGALMLQIAIMKGLK